MKHGRYLLAFCSVLCITTAACQDTSTTNRIDVDDQSKEKPMAPGSQDFRSMAQTMARDIVILPQIQDASTPPKIAFIRVQNNSSDYIDGDLVLKMMRTELLRHSGGKFSFLDRDVLREVEKENRDKAAGKRTTSGEETIRGADFFLTGDVDSVDRPGDKGIVRYFRFSYRLTHAATSEIIWENAYEMKQQTVLGIMYR